MYSAQCPEHGWRSEIMLAVCFIFFTQVLSIIYHYLVSLGVSFVYVNNHHQNTNNTTSIYFVLTVS